MTHLLETIETETGAQPRFAVIWLHGLGADAHDFEPIVPELVGRQWPALRFVFPNAPVRPITVNGGMRMRGWYDIGGVDIAHKQDEVGVRGSVAAIEQLIARENAAGSRANASYWPASRRAARSLWPRACASANRCSAWWRCPPTCRCTRPSRPRPRPESASVPIFMGHGRFDPVVPESLGLMSRDWIRALGNPIEWKSYPMPHSVCAEEIRDLSRWFEIATCLRRGG
jgi:phospholipase/carboxylesterase